MALPGVTTVLNDRRQTLARSNVPDGPRVVALATRNTASGTGGVVDYDPYAPIRESDVITAFGDGSGAHRAFLELMAGGASRPVIIAIPSGTSDANLASAGVLDLAFQAAESIQADIIVGWGRGGHPNDWEIPATPGNDVNLGFCADSPNVAKQFADYCRAISDRSHPVIGVLGVKPFIGTGAAATQSMTAANISTHLAMANIPDHENPSFGANGFYLSVVSGELHPVNYSDGYGYANAACMYAGAISQLPPWSSSTGKTIFNVDSLRYSASRVQQDSILQKGVVPIAQDFHGVPIWVDGVTFGVSTSDYTRLSTIRIVQVTVEVVRNVAQKFVGEPATLQTRNSLDTAITSGLRTLKLLGALLDAAFVVSYVANENRAIVDLSLRPAFELRNIDISVSIQV